MREIKFRAYIYDLNKIVDVREINFVYKYITFRLDDKAKDEKRTFDQIGLMQYIGLQDRNDKGIYEGDILSRIYFDEPDYYDEGKLVVYGCHSIDKDKSRDEISTYGYVLEYAHDVYYDEINNKYTYEVVGNIYENPDLYGYDIMKVIY